MVSLRISIRLDIILFRGLIGVQSQCISVRLYRTLAYDTGDHPLKTSVFLRGEECPHCRRLPTRGGGASGMPMSAISYFCIFFGTVLLLHSYMCGVCVGGHFAGGVIQKVADKMGGGVKNHKHLLTS